MKVVHGVFSIPFAFLRHIIASWGIQNQDFGLVRRSVRVRLRLSKMGKMSCRY